MSGDLWIINSYFNPCRYRSRRENYDRFMAGMDAVGANVLTVELAFGDEEFELPESERVLRKRSNSVLWHKERLLNLAVPSLPAECTKIGWFDNDILFDDARWLERTSRALDRYTVVQPYSSCNWLARGEREYPASGGTYESFAHCFVRAPRFASKANYGLHGHTGFAWAARREFFEKCGLYEACLTGSGDHLMAHAFAGGMRDTPCLTGMVGERSAYARHYWAWAARASELVNGLMSYIPGTVLHLWHGDLANRRYGIKDAELRSLDYDPERHVTIGSSGLIEWSGEAPQAMRDWASRNFSHRREDGDVEAG